MAVAGGGVGAFVLPSRELSVGLQLEDSAMDNRENVNAASAMRPPVQIFRFGSPAGCSDVMCKKLSFVAQRIIVR